MFTKTGVINDVHIPFHDPNAFQITLDVFKDAKVDRLIINGDFLDFYNVNSHGPNHPFVGDVLTDEITSGKSELYKIRKMFPGTEIIYLMGNHEHRLERFIVKNCKALFDLVKLEKLLDLKELDIKWYPYNHKYRLEKCNFYIQHSPPSYGKNGAMTSLESKLDGSYLYGCTHREQKAVRTGQSGSRYAVYYNGWLGSTTLTRAHREVFSYMKGHDNWQQCFSIVTVENGKKEYVHQIPIINGKAHYNGFVYGGK